MPGEIKGLKDRPVIKLLLLCCIGSASQLTAQGVPQGRPVDANGHKPLDRPSNLTVLPTDIPIPQLVAVMVGFVQQLGVECTYCHMPRPGVDPNYDLNFAPTRIRISALHAS
jgi:hypothetical protein